MEWTVQKRALIGYAIAALLFGLIAFLFYSNMLTTMNSVAEQRKSHFLIISLENLLSHIKDAETGQRGYLLTGNPSYLKPYNNSRQLVQTDLHHLFELTQKRPNQKRRLLEMEPLIQAKMTELQTTIELRMNQGLQTAIRVVSTNEGEKLMSGIRQIAREMESRETTNYMERGQNIEQNFQRTLMISYLAGILAIGLLSLIGRLLFREMSIRQAINKQLEDEIKERQNIEARLIVSEERFRLLIQGIQDYAVYMLDPGGTINTWNTGAERTMEYSASEIIDQPFSVLYPAEAVESNHPRQVLQAVKTQGRFEEENWQVRKNGERFWAYISITPIYNAANELLGFTNVTRDLTERRKAEMQIQDLNTELQKQVVTLEALNKELEAFSYSVSHDLRAPLRSIDGFSKMLLNSAQEKLSSDEQRYLSNVCENAQRMGELIDDLLKLSRLSRAEMQHSEVNLSEIAQEILNGYQAQEPDRHVDVKIMDNLIVNGDSNLLKVFLENLLNNAWKFTRKTVQGVIEVGKTYQGEQPVYYVRDNGAGFNMKYVNKLFGVFQRLHQMEEFPGTGIGLATVQRVILRHGGRIWAEGELNHGATFYFSLS